MKLPELAVDNISEELKLKAAKALYLSECDAVAPSTTAGSVLSSASDLGKIPLDGIKRKKNESDNTNKTMELADQMLEITRQRRRRSQRGLKSEEGLENEATLETDNIQTKSPTEDDVVESARKLREMYEEVTSGKYMVSWIDPRFPMKLHRNQERLQNGLNYVMFNSKETAVSFYKELQNKGVDNLKLDDLGNPKRPETK